VQDNPEIGVAYAHAGILAAAKAVWADLEEHGILHVLLERAQESEEGTGRRVGDSRTLHPVPCFREMFCGKS